jgi:uncharacterized membrane protein
MKQQLLICEVISTHSLTLVLNFVYTLFLWPSNMDTLDERKAMSTSGRQAVVCIIPEFISSPLSLLQNGCIRNFVHLFPSVFLLWVLLQFANSALVQALTAVNQVQPRKILG